ncbi:Gfo/Idh/MocA family oxidoreductase [Nostoc sphaeroides CHAB 2801]|uniref:Gfo/Idh/MocA family oxidoreductase n=1 Tax=Nostoc sphaeroides TaxID=446679 RepID=UPI000E54BBD6|nr:Gfo/Idh/MocA family oxidoreductase [Nostoc sphaeroides]MCC5628470.1 Gfo/Idh/MocA family oxidoreductase [Nostoc sphaeroides CHAB 2801]
MKEPLKLLPNSVFIETPESQPHFYDQASNFQTTIVGYGRYGKNYIGTKYAKDGYFWEIAAIVDPVISPSSFADSVLGKKKPHTYLFQSFHQWYNNYFKLLNNQQKARQVIEICLKPELVYEQLMLYIEAGIKNFILPKPVVINLQQMEQLLEVIDKHQIKAAVASQWYYSDIPKFIKRELQKLIKQKKQEILLTPGNNPSIYNLYKVEANFSKENGLAYATDPSLLELPHVLQLLSSIGIIDFNDYLSIPEVNGTNTLVNVIYQTENIKDRVYIQSSIDLLPDPLIKNEHPLWDIQERYLKIYFDEDSTQPDIEVDFWIKFDRSGDFAIRTGKLIIVGDNICKNREKIVLNFVDDQLLQMNIKIYTAFHHNFEDFQNQKQVLSLDSYVPIGKQIMLIQNIWQSVKDKNSIHSQNKNSFLSKN